MIETGRKGRRSFLLVGEVAQVGYEKFMICISFGMAYLSFWMLNQMLSCSVITINKQATYVFA